jgi:AhpC/TSA family
MAEARKTVTIVFSDVAGSTSLGEQLDAATLRRVMGRLLRRMCKYSLPFTILADLDHSVSEDYGVWVEKNRFGRKSMGIKRSSFVVDEEGRIARAMYGVKPEGHADRVLEALPG